MIVQHDLVVHLIYMITRKDQYIIRMKILHIFQILIDCIRCAGVPFRLSDLLIWRKNRNSSLITIKVPRDPDPDVGIKPEGLILRQNTDGIDA